MVDIDGYVRKPESFRVRLRVHMLIHVYMYTHTCTCMHVYR